MDLGGYADHVARLDLASGEVAYEGISGEDARKYIGGRGLGVKYVFDNDPAVDPLSPDNLLCFMLGPLSGGRVLHAAVEIEHFPLERDGRGLFHGVGAVIVPLVTRPRVRHRQGHGRARNAHDSND